MDIILRYAYGESAQSSFPLSEIRVGEGRDYDRKKCCLTDFSLFAVFESWCLECILFFIYCFRV